MLHLPGQRQCGRPGCVAGGQQALPLGVSRWTTSSVGGTSSQQPRAWPVPVPRQQLRQPRFGPVGPGLGNRLVCDAHSAIPPPAGLVATDDLAFNKDACGVGFVGELSKQPSRKCVKDALTMLTRMTHRGACGCEENTGAAGTAGSGLASGTWGGRPRGPHVMGRWCVVRPPPLGRCGKGRIAPPPPHIGGCGSVPSPGAAPSMDPPSAAGVGHVKRGVATQTACLL